MASRTPIRLLTITLLAAGSLNLIASQVGWAAMGWLLVGAISGAGLASLLAAIRRAVEGVEAGPGGRRSAVAPVSPPAPSRQAVAAVPAGPGGRRTTALACAKGAAAIVLIAATAVLLRALLVFEYIH